MTQSSVHQTPTETTTGPPAASLVLRDRRVAWLIALVFAVVGVEAAVSGRYLHDEGVLTWIFASLIGHAGVDAVFFQKLRPALALFYAPFAPLGFTAFAIVHLLVCAAAIPMIAAVARALGQRCPNIAALVLASSPLLVIAAPAGHSNTDAVFGLTLALWLLLVRGRSAAAGVVLGLLLLVRSEVAVFVIAIALDRARLRDFQVAIGCVAAPALFVLAGAVYHGDLLWALHYPPTLAHSFAGSWADDSSGLRIAQLGDALLSLSPAILLVPLLRARSLRGAEVSLAAGFVVFVVAIRGFPLIGLFNFDTSARYLLTGLPALALLVGRQVDDSLDGRDAGTLSLIALTLAAVGGDVMMRRDAAGVFLLATGVATLSLATIRLRRPLVAVALWTAGTLASQPVWQSRTELLAPRAELRALERAIRDTIADQGPAPIVTNFAVAREWLTRRGVIDEREAPVHFLLKRSMSHEITALTNESVGQRAAIMTALDQAFYGRPIPPERLDPQAWPEGTIVVVFPSTRELETIMDVPAWTAAMTVVHQEPSLLVARLGGAP